MLPGSFHLGWLALLLTLTLMALHRGPTPRRGTNVLLQVALALGVLAWAGSALVVVARDHGPGLEVRGYTLRPPAEGPATLSLGTGDDVDVPLLDPRADTVHALLRWVDGEPAVWNASAARRLEVDGHGAHDVELPAGTRLLWGDGDLEVVSGTLWPGVLVRDGAGELHRYAAGIGRGGVLAIPRLGDRMRARLGFVILRDGVPVLSETRPLPGTGPVAQIELRGRAAWLTFPTPIDRADHPLLVERPNEAPVRPADRWFPLEGGEVLTMGHSRFAVARGPQGTLHLRGLSAPARMDWPGGDAEVLGEPGVLAVGDEDGESLVVAALDGGFRLLGGVAHAGVEGIGRLEIGPNRELEVPWRDGVRVRLRTAARGAPEAAWAGLASAADRTTWRSFAVLAGLYLLLTLMAAWGGWLHGRNAGVLHGGAMLVGIGLLCLYRLADPGDPLRANWLLRQARSALVAGGVGVLLCSWALWRGRVVRPRGATVFRWLDGVDGGGARARWLYVIAVGVLVLQLPFGETGVAIPGIGSVQPIELARTLLVVYLAYWTARAIEGKRDHVRGREGLATRWSYMAHALPVVLVLALCYGLNDISPILVFSAFLVALYGLSLIRPAMALWPPRAWRDSLGVELLAVAVVLVAIGWLVMADPTGTVAKRLAVWWDPWTRGGEAYQAVTALWTSSSGGLWGQGWTGANGLLPPAVQDDFILALLAARAGVGAVTFVAATFAVILVSGAQALRSRRLIAIHRSDRERVGVLTAAVLTMVGIQAAVVLGSATGGLPVMGQPLPFVAAAGSHLLLFCVPAVALVLGATRIEQRVRRPVRAELPSILDTWSGSTLTDGGGVGWSTHG